MDSTSLSAAHELHLNTLRRLRRSPNTLRAYSLYVGRFIRYVDEHGLDSSLASLNRDTVERFEDWIAATSMGTRDGAVAQKEAVRLVKTWCRWLWRRGFVEHDPLARLEVPRVAKLHRLPYTESEVRRLLAATVQCQRPVFARAQLLLVLDTGCRIGELVAADVDDVDLQAGSILFRHAKGGRPRKVIFGIDRPDGGPCVVALREWLQARKTADDERALFTSRFGTRISSRQMRYLWARLGRLGRVDNCIPHRGRHTHASELLAELPGADLQLRQRLGHVSKDVLADYVTVTERAARQIANVASLSAKWGL